MGKLLDRLPKSKARKQSEDEARAQAFLADFEDVKKRHGLDLGAMVIHDAKGSHVEFRVVKQSE